MRNEKHPQRGSAVESVMNLQRPLERVMKPSTSLIEEL